MGAINGTSVLLYSNGTAIAMQRGLTISWEIDLPDATNKESAGWANHICGLMNAKIDFDALFSTGLMTDTPAILGAKDLMNYIINKTSLLIAILGGPFPIVGVCDMSSINFAAPMESAMSLAGSLKVNGGLYPLTGTIAQMLTSPNGGGCSYDTMTVSGTSIQSAIVASGSVDVRSNDVSITDTSVYKVILYLTKNSGQLPSVGLFKQGDNYKSNVVVCTAGLNIITLTATSTDTVVLMFSNTAAANWLTTPIYLFKV